jgi:predicted RNase H-like HicB family nuclease
MKLKVIVHEAEEGGYWAEVQALPGCFTQGEILEELMTNVREAAEGWLLASEDLKTTGNDRIAEVVI